MNPITHILRVDSASRGPAPDPLIDEEYMTESFRLISPLDGTASAYDIMTGALIRELEKDAYLTFAAQAWEYVVTRYLSSSGERFGLVLDGKTCQTLAYVPNFCDVVGDRLIIDDRSSGTLRETRLFSIDELIEIAISRRG